MLGKSEKTKGILVQFAYARRILVKRSVTRAGGIIEKTQVAKIVL